MQGDQPAVLERTGSTISTASTGNFFMRICDNNTLTKGHLVLKSRYRFSFKGGSLV